MEERTIQAEGQNGDKKNVNREQTMRTLQRTGYLAFLDVLGFSAIVGRGDYPAKVDQYMKTLHESINKVYMEDLEHVTFSDSVVISTKTSDQAAIELLLLAVAEINYRLVVELGWAVRGCVSCGTFFRTTKTDNVLVAGTPIVDAYHFENEQGWVGVMLSPRIMKESNANIESLLNQRLLEPYALIPFGKSDDYRGTYDGYVVVPRATAANEPNEVFRGLGKYFEALQRLKLAAPDTRSQRKYKATMEWVSPLSRR
jgi:hypothetical protein